MLSTKQITQTVISAAMEVHRRLGSACPEADYGRFLRHELHIRGVRCRGSAGIHGEHACADLIVEDAVAVEIAAAGQVRPVHAAQLVSLVHRSGLKEGLLVNFLGPVLEHQSIRRNR